MSFPVSSWMSWSVSICQSIAADTVAYIAGFKIESRSIEAVCFGKVRHTHSEVAEFVHWRRAWGHC